MDEFMIHLPDFHVVVCKKCQYAVLPSQIDTHFGPKKPTGSKKVVKKPHGLGKVTRDRIKKDIAKIEWLITNPEGLKQCPFPFPPATTRPIPTLAQPQVAIRCRFPGQEGECGYICCSLQQIQNHCTDIHQWKNTESQGRPRKARVGQIPSVPWQTDGCKVHILTRRSCHTWMPECLIYLSLAVKQNDRDVSLVTEGRSMADNALASVSEPIDVLAVGTQTGVHCTAHTGGELRIREANGRRLLSLPAPYYTFIRCVAWSEDEKFLAVADEKYIWIREVVRSEGYPQVKDIAQSEIQEIPYEILFCDDGESILINGKSSLELWHYMQSPRGTPHSVFQGFRRWINHPHRAGLLLGFDPHSVIVFSLLDLSHSAPFTLSVSEASEGGELINIAQNSVSGTNREYRVAKLFVRNDGLQLLIQATDVSKAGDLCLLVMDTADLDMAHLQGRPTVEVFKPPKAILDKISTVLGFIDHSMFASSLATQPERMVVACLDHNGSLCTIHNGSALQEHPLFLPRHWLDGNYLDKFSHLKCAQRCV